MKTSLQIVKVLEVTEVNKYLQVCHKIVVIDSNLRDCTGDCH